MGVAGVGDEHAIVCCKESSQDTEIIMNCSHGNKTSSAHRAMLASRCKNMIRTIKNENETTIRDDHENWCLVTPGKLLRHDMRLDVKEARENKKSRVMEHLKHTRHISEKQENYFREIKLLPSAL